MTEMRCPKCKRVVQRRHRKWYEKLLLVKAAYYCSRCKRGRYRTRLFGLTL